ncbi:MAG: metal ABC transporter substrate-binding protein [Amphritea sp.]|nr:metal ABC transporter substrate-binding protein [Amphritea sp.]
MKKIIYSGITILLILATKIACAESIRVATTLPITQALATDLLNHSGAEVVYLPPGRLPVKRIANWLRHKSRSRINGAGPFDVLVTVESVWPGYAVFGKLRSQNVRLVAIDVAEELNDPGLSIRRQAGQSMQYFWLAPDNLQVMAQILAKDLSRLLPVHQHLIQENLQRLKQQIQHHAMALDERLMAHEIVAICLGDAALGPLADATYLPVETGQRCESTALRLEKTKAITGTNYRVWRIEAAEKPLAGDLASWLNANLRSLDRALTAAPDSAG